MTPVPPSTFHDLIPTGTDTLCQAFVKICIRFPIQWWRFMSYAFDDNGNFSESFKQDICDVRNNCP